MYPSCTQLRKRSRERIQFWRLVRGRVGPGHGQPYASACCGRAGRRLAKAAGTGGSPIGVPPGILRMHVGSDRAHGCSAPDRAVGGKLWRHTLWRQARSPWCRQPVAAAFAWRQRNVDVGAQIFEYLTGAQLPRPSCTANTVPIGSLNCSVLPQFFNASLDLTRHPGKIVFKEAARWQ